MSGSFGSKPELFFTWENLKSWILFLVVLSGTSPRVVLATKSNASIKSFNEFRIFSKFLAWIVGCFPLFVLICSWTDQSVSLVSVVGVVLEIFKELS